MGAWQHAGASGTRLSPCLVLKAAPQINRNRAAACVPRFPLRSCQRATQRASHATIQPLFSGTRCRACPPTFEEFYPAMQSSEAWVWATRWVGPAAVVYPQTQRSQQHCCIPAQHHCKQLFSNSNRWLCVRRLSVLTRLLLVVISGRNCARSSVPVLCEGGYMASSHCIGLP